MTMPEAPLLNPPLPPDARQRRHWVSPHGAALALALAEAAQRQPGLVVAVTRDTQSALRLEAELGVFAGSLPVLHFPDWETLPYDLFSPHPEIISQRIATLYRLPGVRRGVLVIPVATLLQRLAPRGFLAGAGLHAAARAEARPCRRAAPAGGRRLSPRAAGGRARRLRRARRADRSVPDGQRRAVSHRAVRRRPSTRCAPSTSKRQRSHAPGRCRRTAAGARVSADRGGDQGLPRRVCASASRSTCGAALLYQDIKEGVTPGGIEYYLPLFFEHTETLFDYLADDALFVLGEGALEAAEQVWAQTGERYEQRAHDIERPILPVAELYLSPQLLREQLNRRPRVELVTAGSEHAFALGYAAGAGDDAAGQGRGAGRRP